jgi:hypothetical protein
MMPPKGTAKANQYQAALSKWIKKKWLNVMEVMHAYCGINS